MLHVVLTETENEAYFEVKENGVAGGFADSRKVYYREMVARFGHHLAISWNIGEENGWDASGLGAGNTNQQRKDFATRIRTLAYYKDHICVHNGPSGNDAIFTPLLGYADFTGPSIQWGEGSGVHGAVAKWRNASHGNGHDWVVSIDEPYYSGTTPSDDSYRKNEVWGSYMGGGAGVELYSQNDQSLDDFHVNATKYAQSGYAADFMRANLSFWQMNPDDSLVGSGNDCFAKPGQDYLVYLPNGGTTTLDLTGMPGGYTVRWFDPRNGGALQDGSISTVTGGNVVTLGNAPTATTSDWMALVRKAGNLVVTAGPDQTLRFPQGSSQIMATLNGGVSAGGNSFGVTWSQISGPGVATFANANALATTATITGNAGSYVLQLAVVSGASSAIDKVTITVNPYVSPGIIAADGFDGFDLGPVAGKGLAGNGWAGAWSVPANTATVVDTNVSGALSFTPVGGAAINGGARAVDFSGTSYAITASRQLASPQTGTFYVSYLVQWVAGAFDGNNTFAVFLTNSATDTTTGCNFGYRMNSDTGGGAYQVKRGTGTPPANAFAPMTTPETVHVLVAKVEKTSGGNYNSVKVWLDPGVTEETATPNGNIRLNADLGIATISFVNVRLAAMTSDDRIRLDQLVLGTSWLDVVPTAVAVTAVLTITPTTNGLLLNWTPANWVLEQTTTLAGGGWLVVSGATPPYPVAISGLRKFYRTRSP